MLDLLFQNAALSGKTGLWDLGVSAGKIVHLTPASANPAPQARLSEQLDGLCLSPGFVDAHVHLDKACILERCPICEGTLPEAVRLTAAAKASFEEEDVYLRAQKVLEQAICHGTQRMRSFVEVDPRAGLRSFHALMRLKRDYAHAIDLQICAFAQEGLTQEMATYDLLEQACLLGADLIGGCPYTDHDPARHVALIFDLAERYDLDVDFHLDFDLRPENTNLPAVLVETEARGWGGRVTIGHVTQLSAMPPAEMAAIADRLSRAGIALVVLPATDLFLLGRDWDHLQPRGLTPAHRLSGVVTALATNNVLNPFTPFGDANLIRMANLYANVTQAAQLEELARVQAMITTDAARALGAKAEITLGAPADFVLMDAPDLISAIRQNAPALKGWKAGRPSFIRPKAQLL